MATKMTPEELADAEKRMYMVGATTVGKRMDEELADAEKRMYSVGATTVGKRMDEEARNNSTKKESGAGMPKMAKGGSVKASSASRRGDGIAQRGKTKGRMI